MRAVTPTSSARPIARSAAARSRRPLRYRIEYILTMASGRKEHIPPVDGLGSDTPWFEVTWEANSWASSGLDIVKSLLSSPPLLHTANR